MNVQGNEGDQGRAGSETRIKIFGAAQPIGQSKVMSQVLQENLMKGMSPEETLIVLPDEKLLLPVLHGVSSSVEKLNVTMGFPLASTPMFNFIELLADLQLNYKNDHFNHRQALAVLGHPYVVAADPVSSHNKRKEILRHNWVHIPRGYLASETQLHRLIFIPFFQGDLSSYSLVGAALMHYLKSIITEIGSLNSISALDKEYAFQFFKFLNRMEEVLYDEGVERTNGAEGAEEDEENKIGRNLAKGPDATTDRESLKLIHRHLKSFLRIFRQLVRAHKIPFSGEPLKGLQVMGVLETRNLDFKNVFILSLNEGAFPSITSKGSYIPYNIRKAYQLPTVEHQDAIYSYLFYRTLQRAENIFLFYNSETDLLGQGEMSRYLQQLLYESGLPVTKKILHNPVEPQALVSIVINKNEKVLETLARLNDGNMYFKGISPSALNTYLECRLKFYLRHVARIKEPYAVEEELDARVLGNFLHDVMERFYKRIEARKHSKQIETADFMGYEAAIDTLIDEVFIEAYRLDPNKKVTYEGQRLVVREIVKRFAHRIVEMDKKYAPFVMEALEQEGLTFSVPIAHAPHRAVLGGKIDRVDRKEDLLRIIDYKTGKDELDFDSVASLFARDGRRNKAAFQTLLYALLYKSHAVHGESRFRIIPGLINRMNLFDDSFTFGLKVGRQHVNDVEPLLPEFRQRLEELFNDLFDPAQPFDQTSDTEACKLCPYTSICYR
ncbi:MAG: PD-(D/E)XK nuclease family protein [Bacteroidota bacterium]